MSSSSSYELLDASNAGFAPASHCRRKSQERKIKMATKRKLVVTTSSAELTAKTSKEEDNEGEIAELFSIMSFTSSNYFTSSVSLL